MKFNTVAGISIGIVLALIALSTIPLWYGERDSPGNGQSTVVVYGYRIINSYPHDKAAFTQGLVYDGQSLYESTGLYGKSTLRQVDLETGEIQRIYRLPAEYFGEGLALQDNRLVQLTWQSERGFVYNRTDFNRITDFNYDREGWGITSDGLHLIMSDGSDTLYLLNPDTFENEGVIRVQENGRPVLRLNELEFVNGSILANVLNDNRIAIIAPETGSVTGWIDLQGLTAREKNLSSVEVLNGIAYNPKKGTLLVTGKLWPELFEIEIQHEGSPVRI